MNWADYRSAWSALHGGVEPARVIRVWLRLAYRGGVFLVRLRAGPMTVTSAGLLLCLAVPAVVPLGAPGLLLGGLLVLLSAVADGLDGAVAVLTGRVTRLGAVADAVADRLGEAAWLAAFWLAGAPALLVVAAGALSWLHEYVRARAAASGMTGVGVVTVGERPTRVAVAAAGLVLAALSPPAVLTAAAAAWAVLALIGLLQLLPAVRRELSR